MIKSLFPFTSHKEENFICEHSLGDINSIGANKWYFCDKIGCRRRTYPLKDIKSIEKKTWLLDGVFENQITNGDWF